MRRADRLSEAEILIVGGGLAGLTAAIELRRQLPKAKLRLLCAEKAKISGGHLASWDEAGYPIEHGLHALFAFYDNIHAILRRIGADKNFTQSPGHIFVYEHGALHRFHPHELMSYSGFSPREKMALGLLTPEVNSINAMVATEGLNSFERFDNLDLREFMRQHRVPEAVVTSNFFRQFYDAPFNEPFPLSATVGLKCLHQIFQRPGHFFFNGASRDCLIAPLEKEFLEYCDGTIEHDVRVRALRYKDNSSVATGVEVTRGEGTERQFIAADFIVMAVGAEEFKKIEFGPRFEEVGYFKDVHQLECVSSISLQAWFKEDPVPPGIDSLVNGLPEPLSILATLVTELEARKLRPKLRRPVATSSSRPGRPCLGEAMPLARW